MAQRYKIIIAPVANNQISKLDRFNRNRIFKRISKLKDDPYRISKRLTGHNLWTLKVGLTGYRLTYHIDEQNKSMTIISIYRRPQAYRHL